MSNGNKQTDEQIIASIKKIGTDLDTTVTTKLTQMETTYADALKIATDDINARNAKLAELATEIQLRATSITTTLDASVQIANTAKTTIATLVANS